MSVLAPMPVALPSVLACSEEKQKNLEKQNMKIFFEYIAMQVSDFERKRKRTEKSELIQQV